MAFWLHCHYPNSIRNACITMRILRIRYQQTTLGYNLNNADIWQRMIKYTHKSYFCYPSQTKQLSLCQEKRIQSCSLKSLLKKIKHKYLGHSFFLIVFFLLSLSLILVIRDVHLSSTYICTHSHVQEYRCNYIYNCDYTVYDLASFGQHDTS